ncbi:hypothetical protein [Streptococcus uberis]|uniref:hypothetical protein n=1 Tax=Streptococcus uberis TaxID=1349 RepID=UPI0012B6543B|nr:hypothetical protein [Streptococcus uberis]MTB54203.1 hypothetical protein [Streptococcus uberis]
MKTDKVRIKNKRQVENQIANSIQSAVLTLRQEKQEKSEIGTDKMVKTVKTDSLRISKLLQVKIQKTQDIQTSLLTLRLVKQKKSLLETAKMVKTVLMAKTATQSGLKTMVTARMPLLL